VGTGSRGEVPTFKKEEIIATYRSPELKFIANDLKI